MEAAWRSRRKVPLLGQAAGPPPPPWKQRRGAEEPGVGKGPDRGLDTLRAKMRLPPFLCLSPGPVRISLFSPAFFLPPSLLLGEPLSVWAGSQVDGGFAQGEFLSSAVVSQEPCQLLLFGPGSS